jgi:hypothetical protein
MATAINPEPIKRYLFFFLVKNLINANTPTKAARQNETVSNMVWKVASLGQEMVLNGKNEAMKSINKRIIVNFLTLIVF